MDCFAQDVLDWSEKKFPAFFAALHYSLVESSAVLRQPDTHATLARRFANGKVSWGIVEKRRDGIPVIFFANEFFDALPVEVIGHRGKLLVDESNGQFVEAWAPAAERELEFLDRYGVQPEVGEQVEVSLTAQNCIGQLGTSLHQGFLVAIDYGYSRQELLAGRHRGTVTAFRQHSVSVNPYEAPGEQDITAHVNFTALAGSAESLGMQVHPLITQSQFLLGIGQGNQFADAFEECRLPQEWAKVALQLKHLITPAGMGENFQVMVAAKGVDPQRLSGLSGLSFGKSPSLDTR